MISPLLANVYLHEFDRRWYGPTGPGTTCRAKLVRYADDFVICARFIGEPIHQFLREFLEGKMRLTLNREKTHIIDMSQPGATLDFLGHSFRYLPDRLGRNKVYLSYFPSKKAMQRCRSSVHLLLKKNRTQPLPVVVKKLNDDLRGWGSYYCHGYPTMAFRAIDFHVLTNLERFLRNRSQRRQRPPKGVSLYQWMRQLGLIRLGTQQTIKELREPTSRRRAIGRAGCGKSARPDRRGGR